MHHNATLITKERGFFVRPTLMRFESLGKKLKTLLSVFLVFKTTERMKLEFFERRTKEWSFIKHSKLEQVSRCTHNVNVYLVKGIEKSS